GRCSRQRRLEDVRICAAAAEMAAHCAAHVIEIAVRIALDEMSAAHHHARCAEAALQGVVFDERLLYGMKLLTLRKPFDRRDLPIACIEGEGHATRDHFAVEPYGTGGARAAIAAYLRAGETELVAQHFHQRGCGIDVNGAAPAIDRERQFHHRRSRERVVPM